MIIHKPITQDKNNISQVQNIINLYPNKESFEYIKKQQKEFEKIDKKLLDNYKNKFIYFENGEILDADFIEEELVQRVMKQVGYRSVFITKI